MILFLNDSSFTKQQEVKFVWNLFPFDKINENNYKIHVIKTFKNTDSQVNLFDWLIDFKSMSTDKGLFYILRLVNCVHCIYYYLHFLFTYFLSIVIVFAHNPIIYE